MTTLQQVEIVCPVCETMFRSQAVISTNSFGGKRTDFHERAAGTQPLPHLIHMCSGCGFTGSERDFHPDEEITLLTKISIREIIDSVRDLGDLGTVAGSTKYEVAAKIAEFNREPARHVADLLLRAAWCAADEGDTEAERYFRRLAASGFEEALKSFDGLPRDERAIITYLVGELWRRVGCELRARHWFNKVPSEIVDLENQSWILKAARQQRDSPREWFG